MKNSSNMSKSRLSPCFALRRVLKIYLVLMICHPFYAIAAEPVFSNGFEAIPAHLQLDCKREGYPCSLAEADPDALTRAIALLGECWDIRKAGTMADVQAHLENQSDVIDIGGNYRYISFRVDGMMPVIFDDLTDVLDSSAKAIGKPQQDKNDAALKIDGADKPMEVVGVDTNSDGTIDQKDIKRALVLAPYEWQFAPNDESEDLAIRLETLKPYTGNVEFKSNPNESDVNIPIDEWLTFDDYDVIFVATHGGRDCDILPDLSNYCEVWISTGLEFDFDNPIPEPLYGISIRRIFVESDIVTPPTGSLVMMLDFWRRYYGGRLENKLVTFSACETGNAEGGALATAMGGDNFVMAGWTETVNTDVAFETTLAFYEELATGINTREAFDQVAGLGLFPVINSAGIQTTFEVFSPGNDDVRIIELPQLMFNGDIMTDETNIQELVIGTVGDQSPDSLTLTLQVDGVTAASKPDFQVRYRVDGQDVPGVFDLNSATLIDNNYRYEVVHDIPLGFPLMGGDVHIEVIVDLPEGGDSRFTVNTFLAGCYFSANISGDAADFFDGPAQFEISMDGSIDFTLRNRATINADPANAKSGRFSTGPINPLLPGSYGIDNASLSLTNPTYAALFIPGFEDADCPTCGGTVNIETIEDELSISGNASVTLVRTFPPPENDELPTVLMDVNFTAAFGSQFEGSSPYVQCSILYSDD